MSILTGKHNEQEINEIRCRVVESGISKSRVDFLKTLLEHNGYEVQVAEETPKPVPPPKPSSIPAADTTNDNSKDQLAAEIEEQQPEPTSAFQASAGKPEPTFVIGVTDIIFNAVVAVYNRALRTLEGKHVTADYWNQKTTKAEPNYWDRNKKDWL